MKQSLARGATVGLGLAALLLAGIGAPSSKAQSACVWASVRVLGGTTSTLKVESHDGACPGTLPPANPADPCPGQFIHPYFDPTVDGLTVRALVCLDLP